MTQFDARRLHLLILRHARFTGSRRAMHVLENWERYLPRFRKVMPVEYRGVIPGNFDQAVSIVAIGQYQGDHFEASQLLVKCPSKYQAEAENAAKGVKS